MVQRCLDSAPKKYHDMLLDAIVDHSVDLICNPFGNYVRVKQMSMIIVSD